MKRLAGSFGRYAAVSALSFGGNIAVTALCHEVAGLPEEAAFAIALAAVFVMNFLLMRHWVYGGESKGTNAGRQLLATAGASVGFRIVEYLVFLLLHSVLGIYYLLANALVLGVSFIVKFFFYRAFIFARGA